MKFWIGIFAILILVLCSVSVSVLASGTDTGEVTIGTNVLNSAPTVSVELTPDDDPTTPGVQVINPDPSTNKTVTIIANVTDMNGWGDLVNTSVTANITGPSVVEDSPVSLSFNSVVNVTTATYTGSFNMSTHAEGDYKVEVRATDFGGLTGVGSRNFTYSYGAPVVTVTPYDFATGAGEDKWAFRYQINPLKPPITNDTPDIEFVGIGRKGEYTMISKEDHKMQKDSSDSSGNYTAHRFVFNISESADSIVEIDVQWIGKGVTRNRTQKHGATLYIWNVTFGYYEELGNTTSRRRETLSGLITANAENYVDTAGNLTILVVQNANQSVTRRGRPLVSKLSTDYVKIDITPPSLSSKSASIAASTSEETGNSWLDRVHQGSIALFRWLRGG